MKRRNRLSSALLLTPSFLLFAGSSAAQTRPLRTSEAELLPPGTVRAQVGFDFLQDVSYPLSGLSGDQTSVGIVSIRMGVGRMVEVQLEGAVKNFLDVKQQVVGPLVPLLTGPNSTHDTGDFAMITKIRILQETAKRPAFGFQFGYRMPNSNQARGIGTNTSNVFAGMILQKHFGKLNLFGNLGIAILQAPLANFTQNDVVTFGGAFTYPLHSKVNLVGEVFGQHSTRTITANLVGTESRSQGRLGFQIFAGGFQWDIAGIAGLTKRDAKTGLTFGISKDIHLFDYPPK
ncbi:MAG: hypothetical protein HY046_12435 [Acidobacteria bacterium]|nr:hypothetical protein [Acidobacteriota bacterium]